MTYYTFWKGKEEEPDEAVLLTSEPFCYTRFGAFKRAHKLAKQLIKGFDFVILLRKIKTGSDICIEWIFPPE